MNLDSSSHETLGYIPPAAALRPAPEEPVPSRYAVRVGDVEVLVISDGVLTLPTATLAVNVDPAELGVWLREQFLPADTLEWPLNVVVLRSGRRTILVDAGIGGEYPNFPRAGRLALRLRAAGIDPASITDVVLTHMHMDHVGGLLGDGLRQQLRADIPVHVAEAEVDFWEAPDFSRTAMPEPVPATLRAVAARFMEQYHRQVRTFGEEYEVAPGVVVRRNGGHTPGHSMVHLDSRGERMTFAGDAIFPVGFDHPYWHNGFEHDPEEAARVRVELLRDVAATGEPLVAAHLSFPFGRVAVAGDAFRWVPTFWEY
jgi:glyoxylase-like metal-dependent hydrolase (beta-lactamase superfamily II)